MEKTIKRIFVSTVMLMAVVSGWAQGLTATLQQGTTMRTYYGVDAFKEAYAAASSGAVITLSAGTFNTVEEITKSITLIGNGAIGDKQTYLYTASKTSDGYYPNLIINANNVRIEGLRLNASDAILIRKVSNLKISHCYINCLRATLQHTNTIIDQCFISKEYAINQGVNYCLKNCFIDEPYQEGSTSNLTYITNCLIYKYYYYHRISDKNYYKIVYPYAIYKNCILGYHSYNSSNLSNTSSDYSKGYYIWSPGTKTQSEYYNNVFYYYPSDYDDGFLKFNDFLETLELKSVPTGTNRTGNMKSTYNDLFTSMSYYLPGFIKTDLKGDDGKQVGPYGGSGFSLIPSIPRITSSTIDSYTNAEGKINVKIKVENNQ